MKKIKLLMITAFLLLAALIIPKFNLLRAEGNITILIDGNPVVDSYQEGVTISLSTIGDLKIQYKYTYADGSYSSEFFNYQEPFEFTRRGNYVFLVRTRDNDDKTVEEKQFILRLNIPFDESYTRIIRNNTPLKFYTDGKEIALRTYYEKSKEVRGVWVATVSNIDVPVYQNDEQYKAYLIDILDTVKAHNMNTVFFQVRSMNDAFYPSALAPYSVYIKGTLGEGLDWDILEFMVEEAHKRGIELHAWLNPYRIANAQSGTLAQKLAKLHEDNFARKNPHLVMEDREGAMILNPGEPEVRQYIYDVIDELMENYDIDGIHMDDYFYTYSGHTEAHDATAFSKYNPDNLILADWRRSNVDTLVREIYYLVEDFNAANNKNLKWGISPIGIWQSNVHDPNGSYTGSGAASSYRDQYADTRKWVKEGWLHYINPQVYWELSREIAPYADIVRWWDDVAEGTGVKVVVGQGFYRMIESNTLMNHTDEMIDQIRVNRLYSNVVGTVFFSYRTLKSSRYEVTSTLERLNTTYWTKEVGWPWPTDVQEPDTDEQLAAKADLQEVIDEALTYLSEVSITAETNLYYLNEGEKYAKESDYNSFEDSLDTARQVIKTLELSVESIENSTTSLSQSFNTFKENIMIGLGELRTESIQNKHHNLVTLFENLKNTRFKVSVSSKEPNELPLGQYASQSLIDAVDTFIEDLDAAFKEPYIKEVDLDRYRIELLSIETEFTQGIYYGTIDETLQSLENIILEIETFLETIKVTYETDGSDLTKGTTYISVLELNKINGEIAAAKSAIASGQSEEVIREHLETLQHLQNTMNDNLIVGEKGSALILILVIGGGTLVLAGCIVGLFIIIKKKKNR